MLALLTACLFSHSLLLIKVLLAKGKQTRFSIILLIFHALQGNLQP